MDSSEEMKEEDLIKERELIEIYGQNIKTYQWFFEDISNQRNLMLFATNTYITKETFKKQRIVYLDTVPYFALDNE